MRQIAPLSAKGRRGGLPSRPPEPCKPNRDTSAPPDTVVSAPVSSGVLPQLTATPKATTFAASPTASCLANETGSRATASEIAVKRASRVLENRSGVGVAAVAVRVVTKILVASAPLRQPREPAYKAAVTRVVVT